MKKLMLAALMLVSFATFAQAQAIEDLPLLSADRLSGAVGFDYVYVPDLLATDEWTPKVGVILAYRLTKSLSFGAQAWVLAEDFNDVLDGEEYRAVMRWRVF